MCTEDSSPLRSLTGSQGQATPPRATQPPRLAPRHPRLTVAQQFAASSPRRASPLLLPRIAVPSPLLRPSHRLAPAVVLHGFPAAPSVATSAQLRRRVADFPVPAVLQHIWSTSSHDSQKCTCRSQLARPIRLRAGSGGVRRRTAFAPPTTAQVSRETLEPGAVRSGRSACGPIPRPLHRRLAPLRALLIRTAPRQRPTDPIPNPSLGCGVTCRGPPPHRPARGTPFANATEPRCIPRARSRAPITAHFWAPRPLDEVESNVGLSAPSRPKLPGMESIASNRCANPRLPLDAERRVPVLDAHAESGAGVANAVGNLLTLRVDPWLRRSRHPNAAPDTTPVTTMCPGTRSEEAGWAGAATRREVLGPPQSGDRQWVPARHVASVANRRTEPPHEGLSSEIRKGGDRRPPQQARVPKCSGSVAVGLQPGRSSKGVLGFGRLRRYTDTMASQRFVELLDQRLGRLEGAGLLRDPGNPLRELATAAATRLGRELVDLSSNDYLGLAQLPLELPRPVAGGAGSSRLIHGTRPAHRNLEAQLAAWLGTADALLFASGYAANVGLVSALAEPGDLILSDELNHASLIDGSRLSRTEVKVLPHRNLSALREALEAAGQRTVWVITEAYFSMDGTACDVAAVGSLLRRYPNAHLILDEAHSLGVFGPSGRGLAAAAGYSPDVIVGTFGKAFGMHGAFVAGPKQLCTWLWNRARSFVFSTALSPAFVEALIIRLDLVSRAEGARLHLAELCSMFHVQLGDRFPRLHSPDSVGPITPLLLGNEDRALAVARALAESGILTQGIRPPTVPSGTSRIRMSLGTHVKAESLELTLRALDRILPNAS